MGLYIYNDYFSLYLPGKIDGMRAGMLIGNFEATETVLVAVSILLAVPALMIFASVAMSPVVSRWLNICLGIIYTIIQVLTFFGSPVFYKIVVILEVLVTISIVWHAMRWPKEAH